ncbi:UDP-galactose transporter [Hanseniaspora uvarum]|nr:UDP-galactose transporter [Hanseniaspora uvarum]
MNRNLIFYTVTIYLNFIVWGIIQERLFDSNVLIKFNNVIILLTNVISLFFIKPSNADISQLIKLIKQKQNIKYFIILVITQTMTQPLNYYITSNYGIDYLFLQLSKSCKMIPVIIIHKFIYKRNIDNTKIIISLLITLSIVIFNYKPNSSVNLSGFLLLLPLTMEGFTNTSQDQLFKKNKLNSKVLLIFNNIINIIIHGGYLIMFDNKQFINFAFKYNWSLNIIIEVVIYMILQIIGTLLIFKVLYEFDSLILLRITVLRKVSSLLISILFLNSNKKFNQYEKVGVAGVITTLLLEFYLKNKSNAVKSKKE